MILALLPLISFLSVMGKVVVTLFSIIILWATILSIVETFYNGNRTLLSILLSTLSLLSIFLMYLYGAYYIFGCILIVGLGWAALKDSIDHPLF